MKTATLIMLDKPILVNEEIKDKETLEGLLIVGAKVIVGKEYAKERFSKEGEIFNLVEGYFEYDNGLYTENQTAPSIWNEERNEFSSIYHLFGNDLEDFMDCKIIIAGHKGTKRLTLSDEVAKQVGYVDVEKICPDYADHFKEIWIEGANTYASLTPKKYTEEDMVNMYRMAKRGMDIDEIFNKIDKPKQYKVSYTETENEITITKIQ